MTRSFQSKLRRLEAGVWTDGKLLFYFPELDADGNMSIASITLSDLTANRLVVTDADKKLVSATNFIWVPASLRLGINITPESYLHLSNTAGNDDNDLILDCYSTTNYDTAMLKFRKSSSGTIGTKTMVAAGEGLGEIDFLGVNNVGEFAYGGYIRCIRGGMGDGAFVRAQMSLVCYDRLGDDKAQLHLDGNTGYIGIGEGADPPLSTFHISDHLNVVTLMCTNGGDDIGDRRSRIDVRGFQSGGEQSLMGTIGIEHDGAEDDEKGAFFIDLNAGDDYFTPTERFRLSSAGEISGITGINAVCHDDQVICHNDEVVFV